MFCIWPQLKEEPLVVPMSSCGKTDMSLSPWDGWEGGRRGRPAWREEPHTDAVPSIIGTQLPTRNPQPGPRAPSKAERTQDVLNTDSLTQSRTDGIILGVGPAYGEEKCCFL